MTGIPQHLRTAQPPGTAQPTATAQPTGTAQPPGTSRRSDIAARLRAAGCVFAEVEADLLIGTGLAGRDLERMVARRVSGVPLEQVLGWVEFCGLRLQVGDGVFVPRRRSQFLAAAAVRAAEAAVRHATVTASSTGGAAPTAARPVVVVDMCCGVGALGAVIAARVPGVELHAADVDPAAVRCARANLQGGGGQVYRGELFDPLPSRLAGRVDVLVANAPYVPTGEIVFMPPEARRHESPVALDGGTDGLDVLRRVVSAAPTWLAARGLLLMECAAHQSPALVAAVTAAGLRATVRSDDDLGATVVVARRRGTARTAAR